MQRALHTSSTLGLRARALATHALQGHVVTSAARHDWTKPEIQKIYDRPLLDLVFRAAAVHREHHDPSKVQLCTLMNIKSMSHHLYTFYTD